MKLITATLVGTNPVFFGAPIRSEKSPNESHKQFEERTWRERCHVDPKGEVFINPAGLKKSIAEACRRIGETKKGNTGWGKFVDSGLDVCNQLKVGVKSDKIEGHWAFVPSDGKPNSRAGKVWKCFPYAPEGWTTKAEIQLTDETIPVEKVREWLVYAGTFTGVGTFRRAKGFTGGTFTVKDFKVDGKALT